MPRTALARIETTSFQPWSSVAFAWNGSTSTLFQNAGAIIVVLAISAFVTVTSESIAVLWIIIPMFRTYLSFDVLSVVGNCRAGFTEVLDFENNHPRAKRECLSNNNTIRKEQKRKDKRNAYNFKEKQEKRNNSSSSSRRWLLPCRILIILFGYGLDQFGSSGSSATSCSAFFANLYHSKCMLCLVHSGCFTPGSLTPSQFRLARSTQ